MQTERENTKSILQKPMYCFSLPKETQVEAKPLFSAWQHSFFNNPLRLSDQEQSSFSRLVPALLCGEQSAALIFSNEGKRLMQEELNTSDSLFLSIANDEIIHEQSLQTVIGYMPKDPDVLKIKQRSKRFFMELGKNDNISEYFSQIAHLDSAVCIIMHMVENSTSARNNSIGHLAGIIKQDEARHVHISRQHAFALGVSRDRFYSLAEYVSTALVELLHPLGNEFETIGVDPDILFRRITREALI